MPEQSNPSEAEAFEQVAMAEQQLMFNNPTVAAAMAGYLQHRNMQLALRVRELEAAAADPDEG